MRATLNVTTGPDRGKSFDLIDPLTNIGTSTENQVVLSDASVAAHQASIAFRDGRFFIYTPPTAEIEVDGNKIPPEQRVWLPAEATIQVSRRTALHFVCTDMPGSEGEFAAAPQAAAPVPAARDPGQRTTASFAPVPVPAPLPGGLVPPARDPGQRTTTSFAPIPSGGPLPAASVPPVREPGQRTTTTFPKPKPSPSDGTGSANDLPSPLRASRSEKKAPKVAKFITDSPGNLLVKLGEDGHLPELTLEEGQVRTASDAQEAKSNPLLLIAALCFSFGMTGLMLFMDMEDTGGGGKRAEASQKIVDYYGGEDEELKPYQTHLRRARQARSRYDYQAERAEYYKVLEMLRAEGKSKFTGLTGTPERDDKLKELIGELLSD